MTAVFLNRPILPGEPVEHKEHRKLVTVLVIVILAAILICLVLWQMGRYQIVEIKSGAFNNENQQRLVTLTPEEIKLKEQQLNTANPRVRLTASEKAKKMAQLQQGQLINSSQKEF